ncbi:MAG: hypothetical protein ACXAE3_13350 [Candidatus Kariarchaeaceae archaeon]|jgi:hypothetical protein
MVLIPWFVVRVNEDTIELDVSPPGMPSWTASINWDECIRICFKTGDFLDSDELYIFVRGREHSYLIPMDGDGTSQLWEEILNRGLFDPKVAIELMSTNGELKCFETI